MNTYNFNNSKLREVMKGQHCLFDNSLFMASAFKRPVIIEDIARRVLTKAGIPFSRIVRIECQKRVPDARLKDVIFDCYAEGEDGRRMAIEIQNEAGGFGHKREAFYSAKLRVMNEEKGTDYESMVPVYLIILHKHNPYGRGKSCPLYIKECHYMGTGIFYNDGMNVIRVNGDYMEKGDVLGDLMASLKAMKSEDAVLNLYKETLREVEEKGMEVTFMDLLEESREEGEARGEANTIAEIIARMKMLGYSEDAIKQVTAIK